MSLVNTDAAIHVADKDVNTKLVPEILGLAKDQTLQNKLSENIRKHGLPNAATDIANQIMQLAS
jgi:UDP-N-acetylglucosamine--N-acetylmuramyl-(pentapeptide) pyrophosphoryl-undecaprenol N-acetylglucosamine transferase